MHKRVLLAGLFHETNTFLAQKTTLAECEVREGAALLAAENDGSPLGGALAVARRAGWQVLPVIDIRATPGGTVHDEVVTRFLDAFDAAAAQARPDGVDGIYLVLHGAMVSETIADVEGAVLRHIRALDGLASVPLCGVLDLHANVSEAMVRYSTAFVAYRENPHTDAAEAATRGAQILDWLLSTGERPVTLWAHPPVLWPPTGTATASEPMLDLERMARQFEAEHDEILAINVFGGFSLADTPDAGVSFTASTVGKPEAARAALQALSERAVASRAAGNVQGLPLATVMPELLRQPRGPVLLVEPADNIGAGGPGDLTVVLAALLEYRVQNAGVVINDPAAVARLSALRVGSHATLPIGGASDVVGAEPLTLEVELLSTSNGRFVLEDRQSHLASMYGEQIDMGPCAVVRAGGVRILLTSRRTPPFDLGQWRSQGIDPERLFAIGVKAAVAHRRAYDPIAAASFLLETPGPCASDLRTLPFQRVRRPIYPLDEIEGGWTMWHAEQDHERE